MLTLALISVLIINFGITIYLIGLIKRLNKEDINNYFFKNVTFLTPEKAYKCLEELKDILFLHKFISIKDLYNLNNIASLESDKLYGWFNLNDVDIQKFDQVWYITLPNPTYKYLA